MPLGVIAIGGNALSRAESKGTVEEQFANARLVCRKFAYLLEDGWDLVLTHGNGPQVGNMLWQSELAAQHVHPVDLGICDANAQGQIGYMLQQVLGNEIMHRHVDRPVVTLVTQVEVDPEDPAFKNPTKPIGPFFSEAEAKEKTEKSGWAMREDSGRGWRRVVPSPVPKQIVELHAVRDLVRAGTVPITVGGGGIPVVRRADGGFDGVEAVIDKDLSSSLVARRIAADVLVICTAVPHLSLDFGKSTQRAIHNVSVEDMRTYMDEGHFPAGSMAPKVQACMDFVAWGGVGTRRRALITDIENLRDALAGRAGTVISPDGA